MCWGGDGGRGEKEGGGVTVVWKCVGGGGGDGGRGEKDGCVCLTMVWKYVGGGGGGGRRVGFCPIIWQCDMGMCDDEMGLDVSM